MEIEEGLSLLLEQIKPQEKTLSVPLLSACGMVTAQDIISPMMVPPFPKSAMDGYAVKASETMGASKEHPVFLQVAGELLAGDYKSYTYQAGTAIRVMTGSYLPDGYDAVIKQEDTDYGEDTVQLYTSVSQYQNYCQIGEDIRKGQVVVPQNTRLAPVSIGLLASIGMERVTVYEPIKVAILSTGTELCKVGAPLANGKIYNSISYLLSAALQKEGVTVTGQGICADDEELLSQSVHKALMSADMLITTGAVSVGKKDIIPKVLDSMGAKRLFWRCNIQPGTPTMASILDGKPILSLSGNPYAALANFELYFWEALAHFMHSRSYAPRVETAVLQSDYPKVNRMRRLIRAYADHGNVTLPNGVHASSVIYNLTQCNCMIDLEAGRQVSKGDTVKIRYLR